jgi:hypothetical protein
MTHNPFEKQIADKLNQYEVQPGEGMLDSIFEKRAGKRTPLMGLSRIGIAAGIVIVAISALYLYNAGGAGDTPELASSQGATIETGKQDINPSLHENDGIKQPSGQRTPEAEIVPEAPGEKSGKGLSVKPGTSGKRHINGKPDVLVSNNKGSERPDKDVYQAAGKGFSGDDGSDIYKRYFDITSKNRPVIEKMEHKGNSHLYVYQSVSDRILDNYSFIAMPAKRLNRFENIYHLDNEAKVAQVDIQKHTKTGRKPLFIDLLYMPTLTAINASGNSSIQAYANSIRKRSFNSQYGLRVSMPVSKRISLFTGLFYQDQSNIYNGTVNKQEAVTHINKTDRFINDPVTMQVVKVTTYDTTNGMENRGYNYDFRNSYTLFQLPLGFSYNFGYKKFDFALNSSALINMFTNSKGKAMNMESNSTSAFASSGKYYGIGAGFSVMSALKISPKFRLILEPGLQYYKINSMKAGNNINEKVFNKQLTIGLRYSVF